jgi:hypothetical protein
MAFLAYDACMRVCLSAMLKDGAPWAQMFLGDGDTVPLQKCFALEPHLIQARAAVAQASRLRVWILAERKSRSRDTALSKTETWLIIVFFCLITRLQLLGLRHRRYTALSAWQCGFWGGR